MLIDAGTMERANEFILFTVGRVECLSTFCRCDGARFLHTVGLVERVIIAECEMCTVNSM